MLHSGKHTKLASAPRICMCYMTGQHVRAERLLHLKLQHHVPSYDDNTADSGEHPDPPETDVYNTEYGS